MRIIFLFLLSLIFTFCQEQKDFPSRDVLILEEDSIIDSLIVKDSLLIVKDSLLITEDPLPDTVVIKDTLASSGLTYLALGDSYTIGASVDENERWPEQLATQLRNQGIEMSKPEIIATTGWTTDDLLNALDQRALNDTFDLVSLLIGVNNQYRGYDIAQQEEEFKELLSLALGYAGGDTSHVFVLSIPDYGVTPFGQNFDSEKVGREIDEYNELNRSITLENGVRYFDVTPISREAKTNEDLIARDGLHPSGLMYSRWVSEILPWALETLKMKGHKTFLKNCHSYQACRYIN